ncbi:MAG: hypothetical protein EAZ85_12765 [Bacteroidetes bacterium]|nr:MAG: hypothetical protein EAZ85_12765 [Bacteroidota bacterium]
MDSLFELWKEKVPNYADNFKPLFELVALKGSLGGNRVGLGKHFDTNYELYTYAFFLGINNNEFTPIQEKTKKVNFSHHIKYWGNKSSSARKDFSYIQKYMFAAVVAKTDIDFIKLEKEEISEEEIVKKLMYTFEAYTNGGLTLIQEEMNENPNRFLQSTAFLNMLIPAQNETE